MKGIYLLLTLYILYCFFYPLPRNKNLILARFPFRIVAAVVAAPFAADKNNGATALIAFQKPGEQMVGTCVNIAFLSVKGFPLSADRPCTFEFVPSLPGLFPKHHQNSQTQK